MNYRTLGPSKISASVIGLGTWAIGGWMWGGTDPREAERAIDAAINAGINLIDTAPVYGFGSSEALVGRVVHQKRNQVVLATKCGLVWDQPQGQFFFATDEFAVRPDGDRRVHRYLAPTSIRKEVEQSLQRLRTEYIDLYQTHWQEGTTPIADTMTELLKLKQEGKIRAIGVCNATGAQMAQYGQRGTLDSDQEKYSMLDRKIESDQLPYCREHGIAVLAYSPLALGLLTGKMQPDRPFAKGDQRSTNPRFQPDILRQVDALLANLKPLADDHQLTLTQFVLAWTLAQPGLTHVLVGARNPQQALENAKAGVTTLSPDTVAAANAIIARHALQI
jgi:aryl-alcohol dehydrogenase-like predicted oxidoreductase